MLVSALHEGEHQMKPHRSVGIMRLSLFKTDANAPFHLPMEAAHCVVALPKGKSLPFTHPDFGIVPRGMSF